MRLPLPPRFFFLHKHSSPIFPSLWKPFFILSCFSGDGGRVRNDIQSRPSVPSGCLLRRSSPFSIQTQTPSFTSLTSLFQSPPSPQTTPVFPSASFFRDFPKSSLLSPPLTSVQLPYMLTIFPYLLHSFLHWTVRVRTTTDSREQDYREILCHFLLPKTLVESGTSKTVNPIFHVKRIC